MLSGAVGLPLKKEIIPDYKPSERFFKNIAEDRQDSTTYYDDLYDKER
jgi:hypothetical protein